MIATFKVFSALLSYPTEELQAAAPEFTAELKREAMIGDDEIASITTLVDQLASDDIYILQERYVDLFDRSRYVSLHLFEHVYGESRDRGQMMVELIERYRSQGLDIAIPELPDYLPLYLEYLAQLPIVRALVELAEPVAVILALADRLEKKGSPYGSVLRALGRLANQVPDPQAIDDLSREQDLDAHDPAALDQQWKDDPVVFSAALGQRRMNIELVAARSSTVRQSAPLETEPSSGLPPSEGERR